MQATSFAYYRSFRATVGEVWQHLTRPELLAGWLGAVDIELARDGAAGVKMWNGDIVRGRVVAAAPPVRLEFMWRLFDFEPDSHVVWELRGDGPGSRLTVTQDNLRAKEERDHARLTWKQSFDALHRIVDQHESAPEWGSGIPVIARAVFHRTPADLWQMIASRSGLSKWVANVEEFDGRAGGAFRFRSRYRGQDVIEQGRIEEVVPESRIRLSWEWIGEGWGNPTEVTFALEPEPTGTRIVIAHAGFDRIAPEKSADVRRNYALAWPEVLGDLKRLLAPVAAR